MARFSGGFGPTNSSARALASAMIVRSVCLRSRCRTGARAEIFKKHHTHLADREHVLPRNATYR